MERSAIRESLTADGPSRITLALHPGYRAVVDANL
jgi:hypothetical protein